MTSDEFVELDEASDEYRTKARGAVEWERKRLWDEQRLKRRRKPGTELGKRIQKQSGAATVLVDRWIEELGEKVLEDVDDEVVH